MLDKYNKNSSTKVNKKNIFKKSAAVFMTASIVSFIMMSGNLQYNNDIVSASNNIWTSYSYSPSEYNDVLEGQETSESAKKLYSGNYKLKDYISNVGIKIEENSEVHIWLEGANTIKGASKRESRAEGGGAGTAGINVPETSSVYFHGSGSLNVSGGDGFSGTQGNNGFRNDPMIGSETSGALKDLLIKYFTENKNDSSGGYGAGGGGAAIGTDGTQGATGGKLKIDSVYVGSTERKITTNGGNGKNSNKVSKAGKIYFFNTGSMILKAGSGGTIKSSSSSSCGQAGPLAYNHTEGSQISETENIINLYTHKYGISDNDQQAQQREEGYSFGGAGGDGGKGNEGYILGSGGSGGGGGGAGGTGAFYNINSGGGLSVHTLLQEDHPSGQIYGIYHGGGGGGGGGTTSSTESLGGGGGGGYIEYDDTDKSVISYCYPNWAEGGKRNEDGKSIVSGIILRVGSQNTPSIYVAKGGYCGKKNNENIGGDGGKGGNKLDIPIPNELRYYKPYELTVKGICMGEIMGRKQYDQINYAIENCNGGTTCQGGNGGNGGQAGGGETKAENIYYSDRSSYKESEYRNEYGGNLIEDINDSQITITRKYNTLYPSIAVSEGIYKYTWYTQDENGVRTEIKNEAGNTRVNSDGSLTLTAEDFGKKIVLAATSSEGNIPNLKSLGYNEVSTDTLKMDFKHFEISLSDDYKPYFNKKEDGSYETSFTGEEIKPELIIKYVYNENGYDETQNNRSVMEVQGINLGNSLTENNYFKVEYIPYENNNNYFKYPAFDSNGNTQPVTLKITPNLENQSVTDESGISSVDFKYYINPVALYASLDNNSFTYSGSIINPNITVKDVNGQILNQNEGYTLKWYAWNGNYNESGEKIYDEIESKNSINANSYRIKIIGDPLKGYSEANYLEYTINPIDIEKEKYILDLSQTEIEFTKKDGGIKPDEVNVREKSSSNNLVFGTDYTLEYLNNESVGTATVIATGKGNYKGTISKKYTIKGIDISNFKIEMIPDPAVYKFNWYEQKPTIKVTDLNENELTEGLEYNITWPKDTTNAEKSKEIIISGNTEEGYENTVKKYYDIEKVPAEEVDMVISKDNFYYNGDEIIPDINASYNGQTLTRSTDGETGDYFITVDENASSTGEKTATVTFLNNFEGIKRFNYTIQNANYEFMYGDGFSINLLELFGIQNNKNASFTIGMGNEILCAVISENNILVDSKSPAGNYNLVVKNEDSESIVHIGITINKATPLISIKDKTDIYSGKSLEITDAEVKYVNGETFDQPIFYDYYSDEACTSLLSESPINAGTYFAKAYVSAPNENYNDAYSNAATIVIEKANQLLTGSTSYSGPPGSTVPIDVESNISQNLLYYSSDENVVQIDDNGKMTFLNDGVAYITVYAPETENYKEAFFEAVVTVDKNLTSISSSDKNTTSSLDSNKNSVLDSDTDSDQKANNVTDDIINTILKTGDTKTKFIVVIVSAIALFSIAGYAYLKKKK